METSLLLWLGLWLLFVSLCLLVIGRCVWAVVLDWQERLDEQEQGDGWTSEREQRFLRWLVELDQEATT